MKIDVWSDVMCPWCAVGRAHLEQALASYDGDEPLELVWRSFELNPQAPREVTGDYAVRLAHKYGQTIEQAQSMIDTMAERGAALGIPMNFDRVRPGNTFDAHRLLHLAKEHGLQDALKTRLFTAYLEEGVAVGLVEELTQVAVSVGLDEARVKEVLASDEYAQEVRGDELIARDLEVRGVPYFVFDQRVALSGAQPPDVLLGAIEHALTSREPIEVPQSGDGCAEDGCAVP